MNKKLTNYVEGLFSDCPNTKKAKELKEEILSNLNEHFIEAEKKGYSENEAYTDAISKLGNVDELIQSIMPDKDLSEKINLYKKKKAKFTSIGVMCYILGVAIFLGLPGVATITNKGNISLCGLIGLIILLVLSAIGTALIIYINIAIPQEIEAYLVKKEDNWIDKSTKTGNIIGIINDILPVITIAIYFIISFSSGAWHVTWIIFLINPIVTGILKIIAGNIQK